MKGQVWKAGHGAAGSLIDSGGALFFLDGQLDSIPEVFLGLLSGEQLPGRIRDGLKIGKKCAAVGAGHQVGMVGGVLS